MQVTLVPKGFIARGSLLVRPRSALCICFSILRLVPLAEFEAHLVQGGRNRVLPRVDSSDPLRTRDPLEMQCSSIKQGVTRTMGKLNFSSLAVAILSIALLLCGPSGTAMSKTETPSGGVTSLPTITVQAPKQVARPQKPQQRAVVRSTVRDTVAPGPSPSLATSKPPAQESVLAKLRRLERASGSCVGGCQTSFRVGNRPWVGCSASGWPALAYPGTCRNIYGYKSYTECTETSHFLAWRPMEYHWYCTSLAFNK
jgi:hypothetical protein